MGKPGEGWCGTVLYRIISTEVYIFQNMPTAGLFDHNRGLECLKSSRDHICEICSVPFPPGFLA